MIHPVEGPFSQRFGENPADYARFGSPGHNGLDYAVAENTRVSAVAEGVVGWSGEDPDYGVYVRVWHPRLRVHSFYAHLKGSVVRAGDSVRQGGLLGLSGSTGNSTGPHLHFELRAADEQGNYVDVTAGYGKGRFNPEIGFHVWG